MLYEKDPCAMPSQADYDRDPCLHDHMTYSEAVAQRERFRAGTECPYCGTEAEHSLNEHAEYVCRDCGSEW